MEAIQSYVEKFISSPMNIVILLYVVYTVWQRFQKFPDEPGSPESILNIADWQKLMDEKNQVVVCDFFATWYVITY